MNWKQKLMAAALSVVLPAALAGCGAKPVSAGEPQTELVIRTVTQADPQAAVDEIYATLPESRQTSLDDDLLREHFSGVARKVTAYFGCISDPNGGLADIVVLEPKEGERDAARDALRQYQEARIRQFENYNILGACEIATGAEVVDQGDYVILLMLPDNEAARDILDLYIPL